MQQRSTQPLNQDAEITRFSDEDDAYLFESCGDCLLGGEILCIKHNDPTVSILWVRGDVNLDDAASRRLGDIIGRSTHLEELVLERCGIDVEAMCAGLQRNQSIKTTRLVGINLQNNEMIILAPFLAHNHNLKEIFLPDCRLGQASIDILANALSNGAGLNLEELDLYNNLIGDIDLDGFIEALSESRRLRILCLAGCGIGPRACAPLATLLDNQQSNLTILHLDNNPIDDESTITLAGSLSNNKMLRILDLAGNGRIVSEGWSAMLQLVCDRSSLNDLINSNHSVHRLARGSHRLIKRTFIQALGDDDGNLLRASLELSEGDNKLLIARRKIIWSHARGDLNLGEASIDMGAMPRILAWIGNNSDNSDADIIQYHKPPLQDPEVGIIRLGGIYRILRSMPELCNHERDIPNQGDIHT